MSSAIAWPAARRVAGSSATSRSRRTLPVAHSRLTSAQLLPGSAAPERRRERAAHVLRAHHDGLAASARPPLSHGPCRTRARARRRACRARTAAPLRHVGAPAPLAADRLRHLADDLAGVEARRRDRASPSRRARSCRPRRRRARSRRSRSLSRSWSATSRSALASATSARVASTRTPPTSRASAARSRPAARGELAPQLLDLLLLLAQLGLQLGDARRDLELARAQEAPRLEQLPLHPPHERRARPRR